MTDSEMFGSINVQSGTVECDNYQTSQIQSLQESNEKSFLDENFMSRSYSIYHYIKKDPKLSAIFPSENETTVLLSAAWDKMVSDIKKEMTETHHIFKLFHVIDTLVDCLFAKEREMLDLIDNNHQYFDQLSSLMKDFEIVKNKLHQVKSVSNVRALSDIVLQVVSQTCGHMNKMNDFGLNVSRFMRSYSKTYLDCINNYDFVVNRLRINSQDRNISEKRIENERINRVANYLFDEIKKGSKLDILEPDKISELVNLISSHKGKLNSTSVEEDVCREGNKVLYSSQNAADAIDSTCVDEELGMVVEEEVNENTENEQEELQESFCMETSGNVDENLAETSAFNLPETDSERTNGQGTSFVKERLFSAGVEMLSEGDSSENVLNDGENELSYAEKQGNDAESLSRTITSVSLETEIGQTNVRASSSSSSIKQRLRSGAAVTHRVDNVSPNQKIPKRNGKKRVNEKIKCPICKEEFFDMGTMIRHNKTAHSIEKELVECPQCHKKFTRKDWLANHLRFYCKEKLNEEEPTRTSDRLK